MSQHYPSRASIHRPPTAQVNAQPPALATRAQRRLVDAQAQAHLRRHRRQDQHKAMVGGSLVAAAAATLVGTVAMTPQSATYEPFAAPEGLEGLEALSPDALAVPLDVLRIDRTVAAGRDANRAPLAPGQEIVNPIEVLAQAEDALERAGAFVAVESRTTADRLEMIEAARHVVLDLSARTDAALVNEVLVNHVVGSGAADQPVDALDEDASLLLVGCQVGEDGRIADLCGCGNCLSPAFGGALFASQVDTRNFADPVTAVESLSIALAHATARLDFLIEQPVLAAVAAEAAPMTTADVIAYQQRMAAEAMPGLLDAYRHTLDAYDNGRIPIIAMAELSWAPGHFARRDAAAQLERLNLAFYAEFGVNLTVSDSYRDFAGQVRTRARLGGMAAPPGHSNHGFGLAMDFGGGINRFGSPEHQWMRANAHYFGWELPSWARQGGRLPEPWHWEFDTPALHESGEVGGFWLNNSPDFT